MAEVVMDDMMVGNPVSPMLTSVLCELFPGFDIAHFPGASNQQLWPNFLNAVQYLAGLNGCGQATSLASSR